MWYRRDPIFQHFTEKNKQILFDQPRLINASLRNQARLKAVWADGFDLDTILPQCKKTKTVIVTNAVVNCDPEFWPYIHTTAPSYYGCMAAVYNVDPATPVTRAFNCFNNRFDIFRQSWFYQLIRRDLLDLGYVSFNCEVAPNRMPNRNFQGLSAQQCFEYAFENYNQIFAHEHEQIKSLVPYKSFEDSGDLTPLILASKFSIVLETWFHDNRILTFSEKTMRCLQLPRPWMLFSTQYAVQHLRHLGFDVMDDLVDHSYDSESDPVQRQIKMLDIAQQMVHWDISIVVNRCQQASQHNQNLLQSWHRDWQVNIEHDYELARQKALAL
jgi:hypothetical protein